jgi:uncharacterized protein (DUF1800 family)
MYLYCIYCVFSFPSIASAAEAEAQVTETDSNHKNYFQLSLSSALSIAVSVDYQTKDGTAIAGEDYSYVSNTASIPAGETSTFIAVEIIGDTKVESNETFSLVLSNPIGASFPAGVTEISTEHTIIDDDGVNSRLNDAALLLSQAAFGGTMAEIETVANTGLETWLDQQLAKTFAPLTPVEANYREINDAITNEDDEIFEGFMSRYAWWKRTLSDSDGVIQKVAYALSQIFVVATSGNGRAYETTAYHDLLLKGATGNFRDLLYDVTLSTTMGVYLSHFRNSKGDPAQNIYPDENYAREVMQLFTIGLYELNLDGSYKQLNGADIPTYDNDDIVNFAKVFTGLANGLEKRVFAGLRPDFSQAMEMYEEEHNTESKILLKNSSNKTLPANQTGLQDINDALDVLFNHPNVGPFIGKQLIQRLVTSNPSPEYIERVATAFNDNGSGVRGDMKAVIKAILLDDEARSSADSSNITTGKLREPFLRYVQILKVLGANNPNNEFFLNGIVLNKAFQQHPYAAPSVFNFYSPNYRPTGLFPSEYSSLVAPEFQIATASTLASYFDIMQQTILRELVVNQNIKTPSPDYGKVQLDFSLYSSLASNTSDLLDHINTVLANGRLSATTLSQITAIVDSQSSNLDKAKWALYLTMISPEYLIQH